MHGLLLGYYLSAGRIASLRVPHWPHWRLYFLTEEGVITPDITQIYRFTRTEFTWTLTSWTIDSLCHASFMSSMRVMRSAGSSQAAQKVVLDVVCHR